VARFLVPRRWTVVRRQSTLEATLPERHPARFVWDVLAAVDFSEVEARYASIQGGPGRPPYHPRVLAALWIYGMTQGIETAARIAEACRVRDDCRWLAGGLQPSDQTLLNVLEMQPMLSALWAQVLRAMHAAGHIDLSAIAEDGSKLRANASPRSFHTAEEIEVVIAKLEAGLKDRLAQLATAASQAEPKGDGDGRQRQIRAQRQCLARAQHAAKELRERAERRAGRDEHAAADRGEPRFGPADFRHEVERDVLICPGQQELVRIGTYPNERGTGQYRLYGRRDCGNCALRPRCTEGHGRRVKLQVLAPSAAIAPASVGQAEGMPGHQPTGGDDKTQGGPRASLTDPEALMMLATSQKRWEPSYNADISVTRHGVIVSQFVTKNPTDYPNFTPALRAVLANLGRPETWVGDGHYGTQANLLLADRQSVTLYAPGAGATPREAVGAQPSMAASTGATGDAPKRPELPEPSKPYRFDRHAFRHDPARDVLVCPGERDLPLIGTYTDGPRRYRIYGRRDCGGCTRKPECTDGRGRRVKLPLATAEAEPQAETGPVAQPPPEHSPAPSTEQALDPQRPLAELLRARDERMKTNGDAFLRLRRQTVEPVHAQLRQHGLRRLHIRGLARVGCVVTLACVAHNLMKWRAREEARALNATA
jgi:transposase